MTRTAAEEFADLRASVHELARTVEDRIAQDPAREAAVSKLYEELKLYRDRFVVEAERPLLLDLLLLYDSFHWFHQSLLRQERSPEVIADGFQFLVDELLEILYRRDVTPMEAHERFDRTLHRAVEVEPAPDASSDATIGRVLKRGFLRQDAVLRPAEVVVRRWKGSAR
jgi:molecular chaperone GrpE (heat shock protein)